MNIINQLSRICLFIILIAFIGGCSKDKKNPCEGVTCSSHGTCAVENGAAKCNCNVCYVADKLECATDSSLCSGHGMCVDDNGAASCQCDDGYRAERLFCVQERPICREQCKDQETYCLKNGNKTGYLCDSSTKLCTQCSEDNQCIAHMSGWWEGTACLQNSDCIDPNGPAQKCLDMGETEVSGGEAGRCVLVSQSDNDCKKRGYGWSLVQKNDIGGTQFSVCAVNDTKCVSGTCVMRKECDVKADCVAQTNGWMPRCLSNANCEAGAQVCIQVDTNKDIGYCALTVQVGPMVENQMPRFNANDGTGNATVYGFPHGLEATCYYGTCTNPCKNESYCSYQNQNKYCDTTTGRCVCNNASDCTGSSDSGEDTCVSGSCACSSATACPPDYAKQFSDTTWVCTTQ
jgi:hypothetical protein